MTNTTSSQIAENQLSEYIKTILEVLNSAVSTDQLSPVQLTAILIQIVDLETESQLEAKLAQLSEKYPILKDISFNQNVKAKSRLDNQVQLVISNLIKAGKAVQANEMNLELAKLSNSPEQVQEILNKYSKI